MAGPWPHVAFQNILLPLQDPKEEALGAAKKKCKLKGLVAYASPENSPPRKRTRAADSVSLSDEELETEQDLEAAKQNSEAAINRMQSKW